MFSKFTSNICKVIILENLLSVALINHLKKKTILFNKELIINSVNDKL